MKNWYRLDNAAKLFPAVTNNTNTSVFRFSVVLKEKVNSDVLKLAVSQVFDRFPMLTARIRHGAFWNYLDNNVNQFDVSEETYYPCYNIDKHYNKGYLFRVMYFQHRISLEIFHSLTDGSGAIEFLKTMLYQYFTLLGHSISTDGKILLPTGKACDWEAEDSFINYYKHKKECPSKTKVKNKKAFRITGNHFEPYGHNVLHGVINTKSFISLVKKNNATITSYLSSVLLYSIYQQKMRFGIYKKPVVISVPVNLRNFFPSKTIRNFFTFINVEYLVKQDTTFDEVLSSVTEQIKRETEKDNLQCIINRNVWFERNKFSKFVPLIFKKLAINIGFNTLGENLKTITLSNVGIVDIPKNMEEHIDKIEFILYPTEKSPISCAVCSFKDDLIISFTRSIVESSIIECFFKQLTEHSLDVLIYSNDFGIEDE